MMTYSVTFKITLFFIPIKNYSRILDFMIVDFIKKECQNIMFGYIKRLTFSIFLKLQE